MAKRPQYQVDGWRPNGPGLCSCPHCHDRVTTNALGRASHLRGCRVLLAKEAEREAQQASTATVLDINGQPLRVGDKVRRAARGSDVLPVERRVLHGEVRQIGEAEHVAGLVMVSGFIAWESPRNFERVESDRG